MNELALFAGAGGGILGGRLLGWRTVCAVEIEPYPASVLCQRQNDGILAPFPIWDDVRTFDGKPWRGIVDVVSGGFPCQDVATGSSTKTGVGGERSGLWNEMRRIVSDVGSQFVFVENSAMLTSRGMDRVLGDLATLGYNAEWDVFRASDFGFPHERERLFIVAYSNEVLGKKRAGVEQQYGKYENERNICKIGTTDRQDMWVEMASTFHRMDDGVAFKLDRTESLGNGQVPEVVKVAWNTLIQRCAKKQIA